MTKHSASGTMNDQSAKKDTTEERNAKIVGAAEELEYIVELCRKNGDNNVKAENIDSYLGTAITQYTRRGRENSIMFAFAESVMAIRTLRKLGKEIASKEKVTSTLLKHFHDAGAIKLTSFRR